MANDRLINSTQGDSIISELRTMNTNLADIKSAMAGGSNPIAVEKDVNFYDFDGTCRYSYTATEFADLTAMPDNPTHEGLTSQGWNWSLSDAKTYVASYGKLNVGLMYTTSDGKTRLYIRLSEGRLKPYLGLTGDSSGTAVSIDWGDNSAEENATLDTNTIYTPHEYASAGEYVISIAITNGSVSFTGDSTSGSNVFRKSATPNYNNDRAYSFILTKAEIGSSVTSIGRFSFGDFYGLTSITIPNGVTFIDNSTFRNCIALTSITIPNNVTSIGNYTFNNCIALTSITIPNSVTSIGNYTFQNCYLLTSITIPNSVTSIDNNTFYNCYTLTSVTIPSGVTSINNSMFYHCDTLNSVTIPSSVTSIGGGGFQSCETLISIVIPNNVTSIGTYAFNNCYSLEYIKFESSTPPTVANANAFNGIPTGCIIYVPTGSLSAYTSASNYPSSSTYTYVEY